MFLLVLLVSTGKWAQNRNRGVVGTSAALPSVAPRHRPPRVAGPAAVHRVLRALQMATRDESDTFPSMINTDEPQPDFQVWLITRYLTSQIYKLVAYCSPLGMSIHSLFSPSSLWQHRFGPAGPLLHCIWSVAWFSNFWRYSPVIKRGKWKSTRNGCFNIFNRKFTYK